MIPVDRPDVLDSSLDILKNSRIKRGRFVSLYLGLRRMRTETNSPLAELGSTHVTAASEIEQYLDRLYSKSHRENPLVVLTAPFGGGTSPYSARTGTMAPGLMHPTNTWRNNFGIQKGIGCPAEPDVIERLLLDNNGRLACEHMVRNDEGKHLCNIRNTAYRGEEHAIWLRLSDDGYQVVDLDRPAVFQHYLRSADNQQIPIFPLIGMLYCMALSGVFPDREQVGIPEFSDDFGFEHDQVQNLFNCDPEFAQNATILLRIEDSRVTVRQIFAVRGGADMHTALPGGADVHTDRLPDEPLDAALNTGVGAEICIAKDLQSCGWNVRYRANQAGLGYDLEATRDEQILRVEVKSSVAFTQLELQESEWEAAQIHQDNYVLAVVDFYGSPKQSIWYVRNPAVHALPQRTHDAYLSFWPCGC